MISLTLLKTLYKKYIGHLSKNTSFATLGLMLRAGIQFLSIFLISVFLGPEGYGEFSGLMALVILFYPLAGWGISFLLSKKIATHREDVKTAWGGAIVQVLWVGMPLCGLSLLASFFFVDVKISAGILLLLGVSELVLIPLCLLSLTIGMAANKNTLAIFSMIVSPFFRLLFMAFIVVWGSGLTVTLLVKIQFSATLLGALLVIFFTGRAFGAPVLSGRKIRESLRSGSGYAGGAIFSSSYLELDKVFILNFLGSGALGLYSVSFRVMWAFILPITALVGAALPKLFNDYENNNSLLLLKKVFLAALCYAGFVAMLTYCAAGLIPDVFGEDYAKSSSIFSALSLWPIFFAMQSVLLTGLTVFNKQKTRVYIEFVGVVVLCVFMAVAMSFYGVKAGVYALIVADGIKTILAFLVLRWFSLRL